MRSESIYRALLNLCRALSSIYRALLNMYGVVF